jgi:two-component system, NtrC family, sensor kinase
MSEARSRILIIDDHEQNRYVLSKVLERAGFQVERAETARRGIELADTLPDVAILDVHLPDMSGFDVCRLLKGNRRTAQISVLQISASFVSSGDKAKALEAGADGYLTHPIDAVVLVATVRALIRLRQAELRARASAKQWQSTFNALTEAVAVVDEVGVLVRANRSFAEMFKLEHPYKQKRKAAEVLADFEGVGDLIQGNGDGQRKTGEFQSENRVLKYTVDPFTFENGHAGQVVVVTDITDRKLADYALRTAEKLAATAKLAHAIAHEINNPLEALTNLVFLAESAADPNDVRSYLVAARESIDRIARITKQSLAFHRDTGHAVALDVGTVVSEVVSLYEKVAVPRKVRLQFDRKPTLTLYGFPGQLRQVFGNLFRNAIEAAPENSAVRIRVRPAKRNGQEGVCVMIHDRGTGIPIDVQERIFDPFFTTKELKGSGLGLWVTRAIVNKHAGSVRFRSSVRNGSSGTSFVVFLPVGGIQPGAVEGEWAS